MNVDNPSAEAKIKSVADAQKSEQDAAAKAEQERKKVEFEKYLTEGDAVLPSGQFDQAIKSYSKALQLGFDNATAEARIKSAEDAKKKLEDEQKNKAENERKRAEFDKFMKAGQESLDKRKFEEALSGFQQALSLGVDNPRAEAKIKEVSDVRKADEDAAAKAEQEKKKNEFDKLLGQGNEKLAQKKFDDALGFFRQALAMNFDNPVAEAKIRETELAKTADEEARKKSEEEEKAKAEASRKKAEFESFIKDGDKAFSSSSFDLALSSYQSALALGVDNALAEKKIADAIKAKKDAEDAKERGF
jgi:tetratricopeptide (TPR) repeat protein